ncbi:MAG: ABC transporter substrate-binding protein [Paracoccaceae bacterium]
MSFRNLTAAAVAAVMAGAAGVQAQETLDVGVLAPLEGTYTILGEDGVRGLKTALRLHDGMAGGKKINLIIQPTDASPDSAVRGARKLVEQDGVHLVIGPLSGSEGIAIRDYSKTQPQTTFIDAASGALETTYVTPSENYFRYNMNGAQWSKGLGDYIYNEKGYKTIATVGEDYSFIYTQVFGLALEYCQAGGEITERLWVPLGTKDFGSIIAALPDDVDAIYLGLGGGDAVNFLNQYQQAGGDANLIGGTIMIDGTVLNSKGNAKDALIGVPAAGGMADTWENEGWQKFVKDYQDSFPPEERFPSPSLLATNYYNSTTAALLCLDEVDAEIAGDENQAKLRKCLAEIELDAPNGRITLDDNRQAIGTNFIYEVIEKDDGTLATQVVKVVENVDQLLGFTKEEFDAIGLPSRDNPACKTSY